VDVTLADEPGDGALDAEAEAAVRARLAIQSLDNWSVEWYPECINSKDMYGTKEH
jgi:hypothetical protein